MTPHRKRPDAVQIGNPPLAENLAKVAAGDAARVLDTVQGDVEAAEPDAASLEQGVVVADFRNDSLVRHRAALQRAGRLSTIRPGLPADCKPAGLVRARARKPRQRGA
jgi:hypothetical protein